MVILGGLEIVAAGYLYHKHEQNKKERERLREEDEALEEEVRKLEEKRRLKHQLKQGRPGGNEYLAVPGPGPGGPGRHGRRRDHSAPPAPGAGVGGMGIPIQGGPQRPPPQGLVPPQQYGTYGSAPGPISPPPMSPPPAYPGVVTGWPAHWEQSRGPHSPPAVVGSAPTPGAPIPFPNPHPAQPSVAMPPTPPLEYGWKPGVSYPDGPTSTPEDREREREREREERRARRAQRREARRTVSEGEMDMGMSGGVAAHRQAHGHGQGPKKEVRFADAFNNPAGPPRWNGAGLGGGSRGHRLGGGGCEGGGGGGGC